MNVRAKFRVESVTQSRVMVKGDVHHRIYMVAAGGPGNETWSKYTPSGTIDITITNPVAVPLFAPGDELHLDFSKVPPEAA